MNRYPYPPEEAQQLQTSEMNISSSGDCTGLIPAISDGDEYDSYAELYGFLPPEVRP